MKTIISLSLICFSLIFFTACKKDSGNGGANYYIKATIGGTEKNYTSNALVQVNVAGNAYSYGMYAGAGSSSPEGLGLQITDNKGALTAGTTYNSLTGGNDYIIMGNYNPGTTDVSETFEAGLRSSTSQPLQIVITSVSNSQVAGTFSGEFYDNGGTGKDSLLITNGSFNLPMP